MVIWKAYFPCYKAAAPALLCHCAVMIAFADLDEGMLTPSSTTNPFGNPFRDRPLTADLRTGFLKGLVVDDGVSILLAEMDKCDRARAIAQ